MAIDEGVQTENVAIWLEAKIDEEIQEALVSDIEEEVEILRITKS